MFRLTPSLARALALTLTLSLAPALALTSNPDPDPNQVDACFVCVLEGDRPNRTCTGCDGRPFSGLELDAYGVCDGNGLSLSENHPFVVVSSGLFAADWANWLVACGAVLVVICVPVCCLRAWRALPGLVAAPAEAAAAWAAAREGGQHAAQRRLRSTTPLETGPRTTSWIAQQSAEAQLVEQRRQLGQQLQQHTEQRRSPSGRGGSGGRGIQKKKDKRKYANRSGARADNRRADDEWRAARGQGARGHGGKGRGHGRGRWRRRGRRG